MGGYWLSKETDAWISRKWVANQGDGWLSMGVRWLSREMGG
jgi:hypothetical protein